MAGQIPQSFIDELLARTDIVELIDGHVSLRKAGKNHLACCPFHDEKTPSFTVSQDKQFYHCFGCGANGTAIGFLMEYRQLGFVEAVEELAGRVGLEIPRTAGYAAAKDNFAVLYDLLEAAARFYRQQLRTHPQAKRAADYLKQRGISGECAAEFELGYAPAGWDNLMQELGGAEEAQKRLASAGLIIQGERGGYYDRFRDRIMFPIRDQRGRVIGFGGRVIDEGLPKYLNSPETPVFHKGRELYGLHRARRKNRALERVYLVEGYMDVLALGQYGIDNAVAALGTAATQAQLEGIFRLSPQLVFCFDGDAAGEKAAGRAMEASLPLMKDGRQVFFKFLPKGQDPDDYVREKGAAAFEDRDAWMPLSDYMLKTAQGAHDLSTAEGVSPFMKQIKPHLAQLPEGVFKQFMLRQVEGRTGIAVGEIKSKTETARQAKRRPPLYRQQSGGMTRISWLIAMLLHRPQLAALLEEPENIARLSIPGAEILGALIVSIQEEPGITTGQILERWRESRLSRRLHELSSKDIFDEENIDLEKEFLDACENILSNSKTPLEEAQRVTLQDAPEALKAKLRALQRTG